jgi:RimJ/RimL family protein N-acetyltransferase
MIRLETSRLILRDHEVSDLEAFCAIESDSEYRSPQVVHPRQELERSFREAWLPPKPLGLWAVECRATSRYVGRCGLYPHRTDAGVIVPRELALGFYIARPEWGRGFATEAGRALIAYAFGALGARRIHAGVHRENVRSLRVVATLGFAFVGPDANPGSPALEYEINNPAPDGAA